MKKLSKRLLIPAIIVLTALIPIAILNPSTQAYNGETDSTAFPKDSQLPTNDTTQETTILHASPSQLQPEPLPSPPQPCYGPHITANISANQVNIGETVTVKGIVCPTGPNVTVRVTFTKPDYTWIDHFV